MKASNAFGNLFWNARSQPVANFFMIGLTRSALKSRCPAEDDWNEPSRRTTALYVAQTTNKVSSQ
jgi:hypothetical protein